MPESVSCYHLQIPVAAAGHRLPALRRWLAKLALHLEARNKQINERIKMPLGVDYGGAWETPAIPASPHNGSWIDAAALHGTDPFICAGAHVKVSAA